MAIVYNMFNASKWLQDCMHSVELKYHSNEHVQGTGGGGYCIAGNSSDLISDYRPTHLLFIGLHVFTVGQFGCKG